MKKKTPVTKAKFDKDGYSRGPNLKGTIVKDFLPPSGSFIKRERPKTVSVKVEPYYLAILEKEASRRHKSKDEFMGTILKAYAQTVQ